MVDWGGTTKAKNNGSTVIFLHHLNKSGGSRGTNARSDTLDASIILETPEDWKEEDGLDVIWRFDKGRRCSPKSKIPLRVQMNEEGVFSYSKVDPEEKSTETHIVKKTNPSKFERFKAMKRSEMMSEQEIIDALEIHPNQYRKWDKQS